MSRQTIGCKLLLFTRYPTPGRTKTRLAAVIGPEAAARWQRRLTEATVNVARQACVQGKLPFGGGLRLTICHTGADRRRFRAWLGPDLDYLPQGPGELGRRLVRAIAAAARPQAGEPAPPGILVIGADAPELTPSHLLAAAAKLGDHDLVLGPAHDGGYYLLGLRRPQPQLFDGIAWGSERVREQTLAVAHRIGLKVALLPPLADIDRPADLPRLHNDPRFSDLFTPAPSLSVIIPALNEAACLETTLAAVRDRADGGSQLEILVADGGSGDRTREIARQAGARLLLSPAGRALQQNAAAAAAAGHRLFFLHADSLPPPGYDTLIHRALDNPALAAGAFSLNIAAPGAALGLIARGANLRARWLSLPYGDQGLFLERRIFNEIGGFPPLPLLEDFELMRRLARRGRVVILPQPVTTSARRWQKLGPWRSWLLNQRIIVAYLSGTPPAKLTALYHR